MILEDKLKNVCDRFYVDKESLENYGKNSAAEEFDGADRFVGTGKVLELGKKALTDILEISCSDRGLGAFLQDEMYLIEEAFLSLNALKGRKFRGKKRSYPAVMGIAMNLVHTGEDCSSLSGLKSFITGAEKSIVLSFAETECFHLFARLSLILYLGELAKRQQRLRIISEKEENIKKGFESGNIPSSYDRKTAGVGKELERGLEEQARIYIKTLRCYQQTEIIKTPTAVSKEELLLSSDPAGIYDLGTEQTKGYVRLLVAQEAKITRQSEIDVITSALSSATADMGVVEKICALPNVERKRKTGRIIWLTVENLLPVILGILTGMYGNIVSALFSGLLWREIVSAVMNFISPRFILPREICALEFEKGVPEQFGTACVISLLAVDRDTVTEHADKLLKYHLSNPRLGSSVKFGLLMDLKDSKESVEKDDEDIISAVSDIMEAYNKKYGNRFFAVARERVKSESEGTYIPWERKRGAITEFSALLGGKENGCKVFGLEHSELEGLRYILTLDADTEPYPGSIAELIGAAAHPVNRPEISSCGNVVSGYGIIKPRIGIELESANTSLFSKIFAGQGGTSHYSSSLSDGEWCLFGISHFTGKGIIDVRAMNSVLADLLPEGKILSHDILEGGILRCGYCHQAEFSDGFPSTVRGYYKRLGRWTRGDIQLLPWVFSCVKNKSGEKVPNPINSLTAFEITKNAFRALYPPSALVSIVAFVTGKDGWWLAAAAAVLSLGIQLFINVFQRLFSYGGVPPKKHSDVYSGWRGGVMLAFSRLVFLPFEAWVTFRSAFTALWRMVISKKKLLEWVTAAEGDRLSPKGPLKTYCSMISCVVTAAVIILLGMDTGSFAVAVIWLLAPLYGSYLSVKIEKTDIVRSADRRMLSDHAEKMESYFADLFKTPYLLPSDNYQEMPYVGWADRTSPTNIGMCFLSAVASAELGLISRDDAVLRCEKLCSAVEALEKYKGNLYNWYSCSKAEPMEPRFISSVDSGNLVAALATTASVLSTWDLESAKRLSGRLDAIWRNTDLSVFYSKEQKLLCIGLDRDKKTLGGFYDMLAGEARLTYYVAAAKGDIPAESWQKLSRSSVRAFGYAGLASWSGSLFEYLMPEIFLPVYKNSLLCEGGEFAIGTQKRTGDIMGLPWGVSECCYPEFDPMMNYQYKAHGNSRLALGNINRSEYIVSPYSSYLALGRGVKRVCRNLERITEYGAMGRYGLCESLDFTKSRLSDDLDPVSVRTYMTHHLGMSLCSVANALCDFVLVKRFMDVPEFSSMEQLLKEQLLSCNSFPVKKSHFVYSENKTKQNLSFRDMEYKQWEYGDVPCAVVSDGGLTLWGNANGDIISKKNDTPLYRSDIGFISALNLNGKAYFIKGECKNGNISRGFTVRKDCFEYVFEMDGIEIKECICAVKGLSAEKHVITVRSEKTAEMEFGVYFEPQLCSDSKYNAHPEFERLKLEAEAKDNCNIFVRRRDSAYGDKIMWVSTDLKPKNICLSRSSAIGRGGWRSANVFFENRSDRFSSDGDPCVELNFALKAEAGKSFSFEIVLSVASDINVAKQSASEALQSLRRSSEFYGVCLKEKLDFSAVKECLRLSGVIARWNDNFVNSKRGKFGRKSDLWSLKISGDNPLAVISSEDFTSEGKFLSEVFRFIKCHKILSSFGFKFDLAILCNDGGNYDRPVFNGIGVALRLAGVSDSLNTDGGIHVIDKGSAEKRSIDALYSFGMFFPCITTAETINNGLEFPKRHISGTLPKRIHSMPLANRSFGAVVADIGPVLIYCKNSRLLKLIPWQNDPLAPFCEGMKLCIDHEGKNYSLFCENDGIPSSVDFSPGRVVWKRVFGETEYTVSAFADPILPSLTFDIRAKGEMISRVSWEMKPSVCEHEKDRAYLRCGGDENLFTAENPADKTETTFYAFWSSVPVKRETERWKGDFDFERTEDGVGLTLCLSTSESAASIGANFAKEKCELAKASFAFDNVNVCTGNARLDGYINRWSEYQIMVSRLWAKSSAYQNGGATGFRDQLQDGASLLLTSPQILREQILKCCAHQYEEGDVMHWFHEGAESFRCGVRTRCSDDLLWLVREVGEYVLSTGDLGILDVSVSYLKSKPLAEGEKDRYEAVVFSDIKESVFEHCVRAIGKFVSRGTNDKGLPPILGGDWNDGFSALGEKGEGVSLWLAFFAAESLTLFARVCELASKDDLAVKFRDYGTSLVHSAENAWDGDRFIRAVTDGGVVLGAKNSPVFGIDSIAQSFSWFVESTGNEFSMKREIALDTALEILRDKEIGICKLFDKPVTDRSLGYIADYPSGVRENGGQYTHAAVWLAIACFKAGRADDGYEILKDMIDVAYSENYEGENFVIAADVSDKGKCGWSWYTGSAGWFRRAVLEYMLGISLDLGVLKVAPKLPSCMDGCVCDIKIKGTLCKIRIRRTGERKDFCGEIGLQTMLEIEVTI